MSLCCLIRHLYMPLTLNDFIFRKSELSDKHLFAAIGNYYFFQLPAALKDIIFNHLGDSHKPDRHKTGLAKGSNTDMLYRCRNLNLP